MTDEHGNDIDEDWVPENPTLRGETRTPDQPTTAGNKVLGAPDELPHRVRRDLGLDNEDPDPGYDPDDDDLVPA